MDSRCQDFVSRKSASSLFCLISICLFVWTSCNIKLDSVRLIRNPINGIPRGSPRASSDEQPSGSGGKSRVRPHYDLLNYNWSGIIAEADDHIVPSRPKLLCFVMTVNGKNRRRRQAIVDTWGQRCDKLLMVAAVEGHENDPDLESARLVDGPDGVQTIEVPLVEESRKQLWHKIIKAVRLIHEQFLDQFEWFIKTDDDCYLFVDELKRFLDRQSPSYPIYFGHRFRKYVQLQGYMSGGSGYVLSRQALRVLVEDGIDEKLEQCHILQGTAEDLEIGYCLSAVNVVAGDSRDSRGRPRFIALNPDMMLPSFKEDYVPWYEDYNFYGSPQFGPGCCSSNPIAFHYISPNSMYLIDWLVYVVNQGRRQSIID